MKKSVPVLLICIGVAMVGCATSTKRLADLSLGMSKPEVVQVLGKPFAVRGAVTNKHGQTAEVWEYHLATMSAVGYYLAAGAIGAGGGQVPAGASRTRPYWLYFVDGQLVQWGEAGD